VDIKISDAVRALDHEFAGQLSLIEMPMQDYRPDFREQFDLVFWDAGHNYEISKQTYNNIRQHVMFSYHVIQYPGCSGGTPTHSLHRIFFDRIKRKYVFELR
jgi:hypothetical protein